METSKNKIMEGLKGCVQRESSIHISAYNTVINKYGRKHLNLIERVNTLTNNVFQEKDPVWRFIGEWQNQSRQETGLLRSLLS